MPAPARARARARKRACRRGNRGHGSAPAVRATNRPRHGRLAVCNARRNARVAACDARAVGSGPPAAVALQAPPEGGLVDAEGGGGALAAAAEALEHLEDVAALELGERRQVRVDRPAPDGSGAGSRPSSRSSGPSARATWRSTTLRSSRTFPGQW